MSDSLPDLDVRTDLADLLAEPLLLLSTRGQVIDGNQAAWDLLPDLVVGGDMSALLAEGPDSLRSTLQMWARSGEFTRGLVTLKSADGNSFTAFGCRSSGAGAGRILVRCESGCVVKRRFVAITERVYELNREVSRRKLIENQLFAEKELAQVTLQSIGDAVITTDIEGRITNLNPVAAVLTGWSESEARGNVVSAVFQAINEHTRKPIICPVDRVLVDSQHEMLEKGTVLRSRDGTEYAIDDSAAPIQNRTGQMIGAVLVFRDVTQARQLAARVSFQANHDGLTGLLNRQAFEYRLETLLQSPELTASSHSLMFLDLDRFKVINDTCGHLAGDTFLRAIAPLLQAHLRHSDCLARLGGDEFGILLQDCPEAVSGRIANALRQTVIDFNFTWEGKPFNVGASVGQVNFNDDNWTTAELLSTADTACYMAKDTGRNRVHLYRSDDQRLAERFQQSQWVGRIRDALQDDLFCLYSQTIRPMTNKVLQGEPEPGAHFELLLRLHNVAGKVIAPMAFIPAAERYNLMVGIDQWVIETAFAMLAQTGCGHIGTCAINLSGASLGDEQFLDFVLQCFRRHGIPPHIVCFEITETEAIANLANARRIIDALKTHGCRFSLDDFGSGMSSFGYLKNLPVDYLKIDGAFVKDMADDPIDHAMVTAINSIGHVMGLETIAEFVESAEVLETLRDLGVDYAQGYGIAEPEPLDGMLVNLMKQAQVNTTNHRRLPTRPV